MKLELHPEVARLERNATRLLYALASFALVLFAAVIYLEYQQWPLTPTKQHAPQGTTSPSAAALKARAISFKPVAGFAKRITS